MKNNIQIFERNTKEISLFNRKLILAESTTKDYLDFIQFMIEHNQDKEISFLLFQRAHKLHCSLKYNLEKIPKFRFIKRRILKYLISEKYIIHALNEEEIKYAIDRILKLEGSTEKKQDITGEYLGSEQGYALLMNFFDWSVKQIDNLPISKYFMFVNECFNIATLNNGGKYKYASDKDKLMYKQMITFNEIQELKRKGKWD